MNSLIFSAIRTAYHEAGHAIPILLNPLQWNFSKIQLLKSSTSLLNPYYRGIITYDTLKAFPDEEFDDNERKNQIQMNIMGKTTEAFILNKKPSICVAVGDLEKALLASDKLTRTCNYEKHNLITSTSNKILQNAFRRSLITIQAHRREIDLLASICVVLGEVNQEDAQWILKHKEFPPDFDKWLKLSKKVLINENPFINKEVSSSPLIHKHTNWQDVFQEELNFLEVKRTNNKSNKKYL